MFVSRTLGPLKKSCDLSLSTGWTLVLIWVGSFLNNCFFMWSAGVDIDMMGYDVRGMILGVIIPCFATFISYLLIRDVPAFLTCRRSILVWLLISLLLDVH